MIERYDFGQLKLNSQEYLHGFEFCILADIAHLLRPPTWKVCPECKGHRGVDVDCGCYGIERDSCQACGGSGISLQQCQKCHGSGQLPIFYTPEQYRQWFVDNKLPGQEWTGPVWAKHCRYPEFEIYDRESNIEIYFHESWTVLIANEAGKPPEDYTCEK